MAGWEIREAGFAPEGPFPGTAHTPLAEPVHRVR